MFLIKVAPSTIMNCENGRDQGKKTIWYSRDGQQQLTICFKKVVTSPSESTNVNTNIGCLILTYLMLILTL